MPVWADGQGERNMATKTVLLDKGEMEFVENIEKKIKEVKGKGISKGKIIRTILKALKNKKAESVIKKYLKSGLLLLLIAGFVGRG